MTLLERLQSSMRRVAAERYEAVPVPPFTAFFHPFDSLVYLNYAIPDGPLEGDLGDALRQLRAGFRDRGRVPRFEYVADLFPSLADTLLRQGFQQEAEARLMTCTRESLIPTPVPAGLTFEVLTPESPRASARAFCVTAREGFGNGSAQDVTEDEVTKMLADLKDGRGLLGRLHGEPAVIGLYTPPREGAAEVAGVTTLERFRKQGLASALVFRLSEEAFRLGVEVLFLQTINEAAGRVYEGVGYRFLTRMLFMVDAVTPSGSGR
jgi:GNAT superfamily N-acetyltransferase